MPEIKYELKGSIYKKFIDYAIKKSDAFMLVTRRHRVRASVPKMPNWINNGIETEFLKKCKEKLNSDRIMFKKSTETFSKEIEPFLIKKRHDPVWPGTQVLSPIGNESNFDICIYQSCEEVKPYLLRVEHLFQWMYPYYPEDLCFFKDNKCWFYACSHEERSYILADSKDEVKAFEDMGIVFFDEYDEEYETNGRFIEEY